jgi:signal transduction histidine kinase/ActR/RegA family two-component response regulator
MASASRDKALGSPFPSWLSWIVSVLAIIAVALLDFFSNAGLVVPVLYVVPLVLVIGQHSRRLIWATALLCVVLNFAVYLTQREDLLIDLGSVASLNRVLAAVAVVVMAAICHVLVTYQDAVGEQHRRLGERTASLERANLQLAAREEEIVHQLELRRREATEASVRKTRFLAAISHDIRTPVNAIRLLSELMRRTAANPAQAGDMPELAEKLEANVISLSDLINDLLDVARFDQGKLELRETEFSLDEAISDKCRQLAPLAEEKGLKLLIEPPETPIALRADRIKLARILGNLIGNAIKFTEAGRVRVSSALFDDLRVAIHVADTGVGIATEHLPHIFDEFIQLRNPERDRSKGSGLGLAICKRLTKAMGGTIGVESEPGRGTTITVTLPTRCVLPGALAAAPRAPASTLSVPCLADLRVLVVEDDLNTRQATVCLLKREGARVTEAGTGCEAVEQFGQQEFDVVLLDLMLPDLDGADVLKAIQLQRPQGMTRILVVTGDLTPERQRQVKRLGADGLLAKPVDVNDLVARLQQIKEHQCDQGV